MTICGAGAEIFRAATQPCWYAVQTYPQNEKTVTAQLLLKGIETFLPLTTETHRWSDRKKRLQLPLFPGYIFVHMVATTENCVVALHTPRVLRIVSGYANTPVPIPDSEIASTQTLVSNHASLSQCDFFQAGRKVRICGGPFDGVEGVLMDKGNDSRLVLSVHLIQQSVALHLSGYRVIPV